MYAASANHYEIARILVTEEHCMRNHAGETALLIAAAHNAVHVIPILLPYEHEMVALNGATALHLAVQHNSIESIVLLIGRYGPVRDGSGFTAMEYCAYNNLLSQLSLLVKHGHYTIDDLQHAASIADSLGHKECAAALWRASSTYPGTSLNLVDLSVTATRLWSPPNSVQNTDVRSLTATGSRPLTLGQLEVDEKRVLIPRPSDNRSFYDDQSRCQTSILALDSDIELPGAMTEPSNFSGKTSPSIFKGMNGSEICADIPTGIANLAFASSSKSLDSSLTVLTSQLSMAETGTHRSEVRILVDHLRSALEQAREELKEKSIAIAKLEDRIKQLIDNTNHISTGTSTHTEVLSLHEEINYYKQLLAKRDAHEQELKQEITRLQGESTDVLSSLKSKLQKEGGSNEDSQELYNKIESLETELIAVKADLSHDTRALVYVVKQFCAFFESLGLISSFLPDDNLNAETSTLGDVILSLTSLRTYLVNLSIQTNSDSPQTIPSLQTLLSHTKWTDLSNKLDKLTIELEETKAAKSQLEAEVCMKSEQYDSLKEELVEKNACIQQSFEEFRYSMEGKDMEIKSLMEQLSVAQESVSRYKQLTETAKEGQTQSEVRLSQYLEVSKHELALLTNELNAGKEAIIRLLNITTEKKAPDDGLNTADTSFSESSRSLIHYTGLLLEEIQQKMNTIVELRKDLDQLQADNDTLKLANAELKRLNDMLEQPIKLRSSDPDVTAMEAKIISMDSKNTDLHNEVLTLQQKIYELQNETVFYKDKLLKAHTSEELEAVKLRSQLSMYADAYKTLKESSLSMGQELDMVRSELEMYKSMRGDTSYVGQDSMNQSLRARASSANLSVTVVRQTTMTPLMLAAQKGSLRECKDNLQYVRKQLSNGMTALMYAAESGVKEIVALLAPHEASFIRNDNMCAAEIALINGHYECAELLREAEGFKLEESTDLSTGTLSNLISATKSRNLLAVWSLIPLQKGMRDDEGMTALMHAAALGHKAIVSVLCTSELCLQDNYGRTALMHAVRHLNLHVLNFLLPELDFTDNNGKRAIHYLPPRTDENDAIYDDFLSALK